MKIDTFKVERWMNDFEERAVYNLGETCIDSLSLKELLKLCKKEPEDYFKELSETRLAYSHIFGSPKLREGISSLYEKLAPENIVPTHGAVGANNMIITTLISREDNMVCVLPTYQQHYSIPASIGAEVRVLKLAMENDYLPNLDELRKMVDKNTKMITINNPNNPTGSLIPLDMLKEIAEIARSVDAYLLSDEVYRSISEDGSYMPSVLDVYEKGISVGSMSKSFSLAGLRMGWIASNNLEVIEQVKERRDYDTISCGVLDDELASLALANKEAIIERNRNIVLINRAILDEWVKETPEVRYVRPVAGTTALVYYDKDIPSYDLCKKLIETKGVLFTPGSCFEMEGAVRIGYAFDSTTLREGLDKFTEFLRSTIPAH